MARMDVPFETIRRAFAPSGLDVRGIAACRKVDERSTEVTTYVTTFATVMSFDSLSNKPDLCYVFASMVFATAKEVIQPNGDSADVEFPPYVNHHSHAFHSIVSRPDVSCTIRSVHPFDKLMHEVHSISYAPRITSRYVECDRCRGMGDVVYADNDVEDENDDDDDWIDCPSCSGRGGSYVPDYDGPVRRAMVIPSWTLDPIEYGFTNDEEIVDAWIAMEAQRESVAVEPFVLKSLEAMRSFVGPRESEHVHVASSGITYRAEKRKRDEVADLITTFDVAGRPDLLWRSIRSKTVGGEK